MSASRAASGDLWRALASPHRRALLDLLRDGPRTTGQLADALPGLSRFAVMQHLGVLVRAGAVVVRRRGRHRYNHVNPVPLRRWYERWVRPLADTSAAGLLALEREVHETVHDRGEIPMATAIDQIRTVRLESELRFAASAERVFTALTDESLRWFPHTYGGDRVRAVVVEPMVGGRNYEDWGDGRGHLYGQVTEYDRPHRLAIRGRVMPGTILDTAYEIEETDDGQAILRMSKIAVGPMTEEESASIREFGDVGRFEGALREVVESGS